MDTKEAKALLESYVGEKRNELTALAVIEDLFTNGYQVDQARIDSEIQKDKDARANEIATLENDKSALIEENKVLLATTDSLQQGLNDAKAEVKKLKETSEPAVADSVIE